MFFWHLWLILFYRSNRNSATLIVFFLSIIKFYRNKAPKHYTLLDYNTKTEPRGSKIPWLSPGIIHTPTYNYYLFIYILEHTYCLCVPAIVLSMGSKFVNKEEIVSGTRSEVSVTLRLSSLRVFTMKMYIIVVLMYLFFICKKYNYNYKYKTKHKYMMPIHIWRQ